MEKEKMTFYIGADYEMTEDKKREFIKSMSNNGEHNVIFDGNNIIPTLMADVVSRLTGKD